MPSALSRSRSSSRPSSRHESATRLRRAPATTALGGPSVPQAKSLGASDKSMAASARASGSARAAHRVTAYLEMLATGPLLPPSRKYRTVSMENETKKLAGPCETQCLMSPSFAKDNSCEDVTYDMYFKIIEEEVKLIRSIQNEDSTVPPEIRAHWQERAQKELSMSFDPSTRPSHSEYHHVSSFRRGPYDRPRPWSYTETDLIGSIIVNDFCGEASNNSAIPENKQKGGTSTMLSTCRPKTAPPCHILAQQKPFHPSIPRTTSRGVKSPRQMFPLTESKIINQLIPMANNAIGSTDSSMGKNKTSSTFTKVKILQTKTTSGPSNTKISKISTNSSLPVRRTSGTKPRTERSVQRKSKRIQYTAFSGK